jgi:hypothetical protein
MKQIFIVIIIFFLITWFQNVEDNKYKKKRYTFYEKYKLPIFVSALVGLVLSYCDKFCENIFTQNLSNNIKKIKPNINDQQIYIDPSPF